MHVFMDDGAGKQLQDKMQFLETLMNMECAPRPALRQPFSFISELVAGIQGSTFILVFKVFKTLQKSEKDGFYKLTCT